MEFQRPSHGVNKSEQFGDSEVGITHPYLPSHIKLANNGDLEIWAGEGLGMVFHPSNKSVTIIGDTIKFITQEQDGLRWNKLAFNMESTEFQEPTFVVYDDEIKTMFRGVEDYLE